MTAFVPAEPQWTPRDFAATRAAWTGLLPGIAGQQLRVEAGAYRGKPTYFQLVAPWTRPSRMAATIAERSRVSVLSALGTIAVFLMFVAAGLIARHNLRKGRGDRVGAFRLAAFVSAVAFVVWVLNAKHVADPNVEMGRFFTGLPLWVTGLLWLLYLAVEPYIRRFWPSTLVSWSRLMANQWRDPLVGRDILFAVGLGVLMHVLATGSFLLTRRLGYAIPPVIALLSQLVVTRFVLADVGNRVFNALLKALFAVFGMVLLKIILKREWAAVIMAIALFTFTSSRGLDDVGSRAINLTFLVMFLTIIVLTIKYLGLLATVVMFLVQFIVSNGVVTHDPSSWFFADATLALLIPAALALYGFYVSRGGEPLLGRRLLD
jgi:hypothetical protein